MSPRPGKSILQACSKDESMKNKRTELIVGIFGLCSIVILIAGILFLKEFSFKARGKFRGKRGTPPRVEEFPDMKTLLDGYMNRPVPFKTSIVISSDLLWLQSYSDMFAELNEYNFNM